MKIIIYERTIKSYKELIDNLDEDVNKQMKKNIYERTIKSYTELIAELQPAPVVPVVPEPAPVVPEPAPVVPSPAPVVPAPSSATQSVAKSADEQKLEKIKALLQANEAIIKECGFKIEP